MDVDPLVQSLCEKAFAGADLQGFKQLLNQLSPQQINGRNTRGQTALYCAARENHIDFARTLLQEGADINLTISGVGSTPLHGTCYCREEYLSSVGAAYHGHSEMVALLLLAGANPDIKNSGLDKLTPREEATGGVHFVFPPLLTFLRHWLFSRSLLNRAFLVFKADILIFPLKKLLVPPKFWPEHQCLSVLPCQLPLCPTPALPTLSRGPPAPSSRA